MFVVGFSLRRRSAAAGGIGGRAALER